MSNRYFFPLLILMFCWGCAQQGSPSGGPRDEDPPVVLESEPPNYSIQFKAKKIQITFDEYIVLDNVNQELIVSPPMEEKPEVKLRKKNLIVEFEEELKANTTYTFNFGSAIKDLHEGNVLLNFEYVFSTGDVLDSLSVKGTLKYAEDLSEPSEPLSIMLYEDLRDSVPLIDIPLYVGRSDDSGVFSVNNLRPDVYKVFALKDGNNNFLFDLPSEEIAFLDTSLIVNADFARQILISSGLIDSTDLIKDTLVIPTDSVPLLDTALIVSDSISETGPDLNSIYIDLMLFIEETEIQYITDYSREDPRKIEMVFARPLTDTFFYRPLPTADTNMKILEQYGADRDSLTLWIMDSTYYKKDTLRMEVNFTVKDTAGLNVTQTDTLRFTYRAKTTSRRKTEIKERKTEKLEVSTIRRNGEQDLHGNLVIDLDFPLLEIRDSLIRLYHIPDSVEVAVPIQIAADTALPTRGWISAEWQSNSQYRMVIQPGAIVSIYPLEHDTIDISFRTRDIEYYGQIILKLENVQQSIVMSLISGDKVIREQIVDKPGEYIFSYLAPKEYRIKFVHDLNGNGKWDTGKYIKKMQPEPVEFLPVGITVRSNWDHEVTMKLEK